MSKSFNDFIYQDNESSYSNEQTFDDIDFISNHGRSTEHKDIKKKDNYIKSSYTFKTIRRKKCDIAISR